MDACPTCMSPLPPLAKQCPSCGQVLVRTDGEVPMGLPLGSLLQGKYQIERALGQGGFGITYQATALLLKTKVAIKEYFPEGAVRIPGTTHVTWRKGTTAGIDLVTAEAQAIARFSHPGIVRVFDVFEENNTAYVVMELLHGMTLEERINKGPALSAKELSEVGIKAAEALSVVHEQSVLHRDLKPANIFLAKDRVVLIDFGSAREFIHGKTVRHSRIISPGYAPLEQYLEAGKMGPYTDIYALGATLYHALCGNPPPDAVNRSQGAEVPPLPANTPKNLQNAIRRALEVEVAKRPQSTAAWIALLKNEPLPRPAPAPRPNPAPRPQPSPAPAPSPQPNPSPTPNPTARRTASKAPAVVVGLVVVALLGWLGLGWIQSQQEAQVTPTRPSGSSQPASQGGSTPANPAPKVTPTPPKAPVTKTPAPKAPAPKPATNPAPVARPTPPTKPTVQKIAPKPATNPAPKAVTPTPAKAAPKVSPPVPSSSGPRVTPLPSNAGPKQEPVVQPIQPSVSSEPKVDSVAPRSPEGSPASSPSRAPVFEPLE